MQNVKIALAEKHFYTNGAFLIFSTLQQHEKYIK